MKKIFLFAGIVFYQGIKGQVITKSDTAIVLKTDEYNNFKANKQATQYTGTIALDSAENQRLLSQGKTTMVSFNYMELTGKADSLYKMGACAAAANLYTTAFKKNNDRGQVKHRYNAACCYARLKQNDSAFFQLYRIAEKGNYYNYNEIEADKCFDNLHADSKWQPLIRIIKNNAGKVADKLNAAIIKKE